MYYFTTLKFGSSHINWKYNLRMRISRISLFDQNFNDFGWNWKGNLMRRKWCKNVALCISRKNSSTVLRRLLYISRNDSLAQMNGNGYRMHDACTLLPCVLERTIYRSFEVHEIEHIKETIVKYAFACIFGYI